MSELPPPSLRDGPPPPPGEEFAASASRLAGFCGVVLGWAPEVFWRATPAEVAALVAVLRPAETAPVDAGALARLRERFPDER